MTWKFFTRGISFLFWLYYAIVTCTQQTDTLLATQFSKSLTTSSTPPSTSVSISQLKFFEGICNLSHPAWKLAISQLFKLSSNHVHNPFGVDVFCWRSDQWVYIEQHLISWRRKYFSNSQSEFFWLELGVLCNRFHFLKSNFTKDCFLNLPSFASTNNFRESSFLPPFDLFRALLQLFVVFVAILNKSSRSEPQRLALVKITFWC